jgi:DMSO/TMAO reductase YedYZ molybdopterin-dependent catalytic subunit
MYFGKVKSKGDPNRVPPNQHVTTKFPVLHAGNVPYYEDLSKWDLQVFGLLDHPKRFTYENLMNMEQVDQDNDIHCVTGWSKLDNVWRGISTLQLVKDLGLREKANYCIIHAEEGWTTNLPLDDFLKETSLLAHSHNGEPLTPEHGFPFRAVFPHLYFWKSAKWIRAIQFTEHNHPGFWERNGYHMNGDPWKEERFTWD